MRISSRALKALESRFTTLTFSMLAQRSRVKPVIDLTLGQPDIEPPRTLIELLIREARCTGVSRYAPPSGLPELREAIALYMSEVYGVEPSVENVVVLAGAKPGILASIYAVVDPGDYVLIFTPHFYAYTNVADMLNVKVLLLKLSWSDEGLCIDEEKFLEYIDQYKPKLVILNSPHNPTSLTFSQETLKLIRDVVVDKDIWVLSDEVYARLVYNPSLHKPALKLFDHGKVIHLDSFSKTLAIPGWRVGFIYAPQQVAKIASYIASNIYTCIPRFIQRALAKFITSYREDMEAFIEAMRRRYLDRLNVFLESIYVLKGLVNWYRPHAAFYIFMEFKDFMKKLGIGDSLELAKKLVMEAGIATVPGMVFGEWPNHLRISLTAPEDKLKEVVTRLYKLLERG